MFSTHLTVFYRILLFNYKIDGAEARFTCTKVKGMRDFMNTKLIISVGDMIEKIKNLNNENNDLLWFRGHSVESWELVPSVQRGNYKKVEQRLLNEFLMKSAISMKNSPNGDEYVPGWMTLMQHYGLPTRLLDWSASPLIALFFATNDYGEYKFETDK